MSLGAFLSSAAGALLVVASWNAVIFWYRRHLVPPPPPPAPPGAGYLLQVPRRRRAQPPPRSRRGHQPPPRPRRHVPRHRGRHERQVAAGGPAVTTLILAGTHATGTAGHLRYFEWTDRYADAYMQLYGIPPHQMGDTSHPADYGIEWPRQIEIEVNETLRDVIVRAYFDHCVVGVSRAIPRRPPRPKPQRRIWGVFARIR